MFRHLLTASVALLAMSALMVASPEAEARPRVVVMVAPAPPPPAVVVVPARVWVPAQVTWDPYQGRNVLVMGHWEDTRPDARWIPGHWVSQGRSRTWVPGHWAAL